MSYSRPFRSGALAVAAIAAIAVAGCASNRSLGGGIDDTGADMSMRTSLLRDGKYDYTDIDISVFEGRMLLVGTMRTEEGKANVDRLAHERGNVTDVYNEIIVGPKTTFQQAAKDEVIEQQLGAALLADAGVVRGNFVISASQGVVHILGVAQGPTELGIVTDHARRTDGVKRVVSHVLYVGDPSRVTR